MSKKASNNLVARLRRLIKDDRLHPNRVLLACMILGNIEGQEICTKEFIHDIFGTSKRLTLNDPEEGPQPTSAVDKEATDTIKAALKDVLGE